MLYNLYNIKYFSLENHAIADRHRMQILPNQMSKKLRWFRTAYLNQRFYTWIIWLSFAGFFVFYNLTTFRWFGVGSMVNNFQKEYSETKRAAREADAIENCAEYIPGNRSYINRGILGNARSFFDGSVQGLKLRPDQNGNIR